MTFIKEIEILEANRIEPLVMYIVEYHFQIYHLEYLRCLYDGIFMLIEAEVNVYRNKFYNKYCTQFVCS